MCSAFLLFTASVFEFIGIEKNLIQEIKTNLFVNLYRLIHYQETGKHMVHTVYYKHYTVIVCNFGNNFYLSSTPVFCFMILVSSKGKSELVKDNYIITSLLSFHTVVKMLFTNLYTTVLVFCF